MSDFSEGVRGMVEITAESVKVILKLKAEIARLTAELEEAREDAESRRRTALGHLGLYEQAQKELGALKARKDS